MTSQNSVASAARQSSAHISVRLRRLFSAHSDICVKLSVAVARTWRRFCALTRISLSAVCEESANLGRYDFHTFADDVDGATWSTQGGACCKRCGKKYRL